MGAELPHFLALLHEIQSFSKFCLLLLHLLLRRKKASNIYQGNRASIFTFQQVSNIQVHDINIPRAARVCFNKKRFPDFTDWLVVPKTGGHLSIEKYLEQENACLPEWCLKILWYSAAVELIFPIVRNFSIWCRQESRTWINMTSKQVSISSRKDMKRPNIQNHQTNINLKPFTKNHQRKRLLQDKSPPSIPTPSS